MAINNPYIPGDPYSYDLKWIIRKLKEHSTILSTLDETITEKIVQLLDQHDPLYWPTAADLIASDMKTPSLAYIEGFYAAGDGGANLYYVTSDYNDVLAADFYLTMDGANRWAIPVITTPYVTPEMFGAKGDGTTDDTLAVKTAFNMSKTVFIINDYAVMPESDGAAVVEIDTPHTVTGGGSLKILPNSFDGYNIFYVTGEDVTIENVTLIGDKDTHTGSSGEHGNLLAIYGENVRVENVKCEKAWGDGIYVRSAEDVHIDGVTCDNNRRNAISVTSGSRIFIENSSFINTSGTAPEAGIAIEANLTTDLIDCRVVNCVATGNAGTDGFYATLRANNSSVFFTNIVSDKANSAAFLSGQNSNITVKNCKWREQDSRGAYIFRMEDLGNYLVYSNNEINASGASTVIYQLGAGLSNLIIEKDIVKNGTFTRPALWLGTHAGTDKHVDLIIKNSTFTSPNYPWYYTDDRTTEYLHIDNDEVREITSPAGFDYVHDKIIVPASSTMTLDQTITSLDLFYGQKVIIENNSSVRLIVSSSQVLHTTTASSNNISLIAGALAIIEAGITENAMHRLPN